MSGTSIEYFKLSDGTMLEGRMHWNDNRSWISVPLSDAAHLVGKDELKKMFEQTQTTQEICVHGGVMDAWESRRLVSAVWDRLDELIKVVR